MSSYNINKQKNVCIIRSVNILKKICFSVIFAFSIFNVTAVLSSEKKTIAITKIVEHESLDQAHMAIMDVLKENGYKDGKNVKIIYKNAQNSLANSVIIAKKFAILKPDAIISISTQSTQSVLNAVSGLDIPVVFSSVTDPVSSGLVRSIDSPVKNITGAVDCPPIKETVDLIKQVLPNIKTLGFLYNPSEYNSVASVNLMKKIVSNKFDFIDAQVTNSTQISQVFCNLVGRVDGIYIPSDNTIFSALPKLVQLSRKYKLPIFSNDPDSVKVGVFGCIGYTQYDVGMEAGKLLIKILSGKKLLKIKKPSREQIFINKKSADIMDIDIPDTLLGRRVNLIY